MYYGSTRDIRIRLTASEAISAGLGPDGGLLVPEVLPRLPRNGLEELSKMSYQQRAVYIMGMFLDGFSAGELTGFVAEAYGKGKFGGSNPAPLRDVGEGTWCLELWHGPTCAFKDMALQMLPHLLTAALRKTEEGRTACILTATSGDTGKAALEGFRDVEGTRILVFYPKDGVSPMQRLQMVTQEGENVGVCAVEGNFDDAQAGVKRLFSDRELGETLSRRGYFFSSANSINWGRVLPQIVYYVSAYCDLVRDGKLALGERCNVCVPTGNFGNILAAYYAREMGVPFGRLLCASNANNVLTDFLGTGVYDRRREFFHTLSPSMDILISSNLERLLFALSGGEDGLVRDYMDQLAGAGRYQVNPEILHRLQGIFWSGWCGDEATEETIARLWREGRYLIDPHTAVAFHGLEEYRRESGDTTPTVVVSTASPFKFCPSVLKALGEAGGETENMEAVSRLSALTGVEAPKTLVALAEKQIRFTETTPKERMGEQVLKFLGE